MKLLIPLILAPLLAATCDHAFPGDETLAAYGAADRTWVLDTIDDESFTARATLTFPEAGRVAGQAPCNGFSGPQTAPYPWFDVGPLVTTRRACPDLASETAFLAALAEMTLAEVQGAVLILSNGAGREMVFSAASE